MCVLEDVPRERILFGAKDVGDKRLLNKALIGSENLVSKVKAKVMFIQNLNDHIKNGVQDTVVSFVNGLQLQLLLQNDMAWAMTAQKAQGKHWVL